MERLIPGFMTYLMQVKNASKSTMSSYERDSLIQAGWKNEGIAFNAYSK